VYDVVGYKKMCNVRETRGHQVAVLVIQLVHSSTEGSLLEVKGELMASASACSQNRPFCKEEISCK
jgi:hypothetical protein